MTSASSASTEPTDVAPAEAPGTTGGRTPKAERWLGVALALISGLAMACQGRINGALGAGLGDSMLAAVVSFGGGLLLLTLTLPFAPKIRRGVTRVRAAVREGGLKPWHCLGGVAGATFVAGQAVTVSVIGVAMFTVGVVAGQTVSSLFVDRAGLGPSGPQPLNWPRIGGALLMMAAVAGSLSGGIGGGAGSAWLLILPVVGGAAMAVQQAINGRVGAAAGNALTAALINFAVGTLALVLAWLVSLVIRGGPSGLPGNPVLYLGGLVGIFFIGLAAFIVRWTGVLLLGLTAIAGQLIGSVLLDLLVPAKAGHLSGATLIGTGVGLVAIVIVAMGGQRAGSRT